MRYLGGKAKIARYVADVVCAALRPGQAVWEPFCGGLNVTAELARRGVDVIATDASVPLMALLMAVRDGWVPPATLSEAEYRAAKALPVSDPLHGFAGFVSFGGCYWSGYPKGDYSTSGITQAEGLRRALLRDVPSAALLACVDFLAVEPYAIDAVIYCDPPYQGTSGYKSTARFDHARFVERVQQWARHTTVLVSEYDFPIGDVVLERTKLGDIRKAKAPRVERIYRIQPRST